MEIQNNSESVQSVEIYAAAASIGDAKFNFAEGRTPNELSTWVSLDRTRIDLPAYGRAPVMTTIQVPQLATRGEQYAVIWAQVAAPPTPSRHVGMAIRVGVRVYLNVGPDGEPPSDFEIDNLTTARSPDGRPELRAEVHNTGGRALDMGGTLALSEGPGSLNAGPFDVTVGTTLAPGDRAPVSVLLDKQLPNGPWKAVLTLRSGLIVRTVTAIITFPDEAGIGGSVVRSDWSWLEVSALVLMALIAIAAIVAGLRYWAKRRRARE